MAFQLFKGIAWTRRLTVTDEATGGRIDLTGRTVQLTLKRRSSEAALITLSEGDGIELLAQTGDTEGQADVTITGDQSGGLEAANHVIAVLVDGRVVVPPLKLPVRDV